MEVSLNSTLILTILLAIGLFFFLRASSKDRTTTVQISSRKEPVEALSIIVDWLIERGWKQINIDSDKKILVFKGQVVSSKGLAFFLSLLGGLGSCALGLVIVQIYPVLSWYPILLGLVGGPISGIVYYQKSSREETFEFKLVEFDDIESTQLIFRAHRDELISLENELGEKLELKSDGSLFKTPI